MTAPVPVVPPRPRLARVHRALWSLIALAVISTGCASASTATGEPDAAVATAAVALEEAAQAAVADDDTTPDQPDADEADADEADAGEADAGEADAGEADADEADADSPRADAAVAADSGQDEAASTNDELVDEFTDTDLPPAPIGFEALTPEPGGRQPVSIAIEDIEVVDATIIPVGVNPDQTFEVPPADQVGWYRFGPAPGEEGSAVLAAHIAFDGVDGVFRHLADVEVGAVVVVGYDDGTSQRYRIDSVTDYFKEELPPELFARDGDAQLALITCGGAFNPQLRSYESNTVAVATPI